VSSYQISIETVAQFIEAESDPAQQRYVFAYQITIRNEGELAAQLISRHWLIEEAEGPLQEVRGLGVVGEQPMLAPGQAFTYTSGCVLRSAVGSMRGSYLMQAADGHNFEAEIPRFILAMPRVLH
jgi:ApaG protein